MGKAIYLSFLLTFARNLVQFPPVPQGRKPPSRARSSGLANPVQQSIKIRLYRLSDFVLRIYRRSLSALSGNFNQKRVDYAKRTQFYPP